MWPFFKTEDICIQESQSSNQLIVAESLARHERSRSRVKSSVNFWLVRSSACKYSVSYQHELTTNFDMLIRRNELSVFTPKLECLNLLFRSKKIQNIKFKRTFKK